MVQHALGSDPARIDDLNDRVIDANMKFPWSYWELEWTAEVAAALKMNIAGGEQDNDLAQFRRMLRLRAVDIVQPDLCYAQASYLVSERPAKP